MFLGFVSCSFPTNVVRKVRTRDEALKMNVLEEDYRSQSIILE